MNRIEGLEETFYIVVGTRNVSIVVGGWDDGLICTTPDREGLTGDIF